MSPIYVSFYTVGNGYDLEAAELIKTLDTFGLPADVLGIPPFSCWTEACAYKPLFLQKMRRKHGRRPLVWLDADARVKQYPRLFLDMPPHIDFAAHWKDGSELLSGTMYFGPTAAADALINEWAKGCCEHAPSGVWDQKVLQDIVDPKIQAALPNGLRKPADLPRQPTLKVEKLPPEYTAIFDAGMCPTGKEVILHMQASRRLRR